MLTSGILGKENRQPGGPLIMPLTYFDVFLCLEIIGVGTTFGSENYLEEPK